jgi:hypothetical protein
VKGAETEQTPPQGGLERPSAALPTRVQRREMPHVSSRLHSLGGPTLSSAASPTPFCGRLWRRGGAVRDRSRPWFGGMV